MVLWEYRSIDDGLIGAIWLGGRKAVASQYFRPQQADRDGDEVLGLSAAQSRAARGLLGMTQQALADASGISRATIQQFERGAPGIKHATRVLIRRTFVCCGLVFLPRGEHGEGVRLARPSIGAAIHDEFFSRLIGEL
ncbi:helix-turn-helix transcriptional regulator [Roseomonas hellenica]|uniref:Helix-turn-helix transcriptional regulator n=1 Tax=Plastoroseomonas hellenica TaxID=2687306 RepID=A0ABS5EWS7_9PROT|nr:helix-turn-helix transcriptional regulator [Plastoroseomonas hellenica]MBR0664744.1 helix-turn-helix transcriptional regulator [Plastoroseomonas hellenica]